jgi:hypothetical protein
MVKSETISDKYVKHISDTGLKIRQVETGRIFNEAVDRIPCQFTYEETDIESDIEPNYKAMLDIITGGAE